MTTVVKMSKHITGFCGIGSHEGTKPKSPSGKPLKTCEDWVVCGCDCHKQITSMFEMTGRERVPVPNPEYITPERTYWMPSDEPNYGLPEPSPDIGQGGALVAERGAVQITESGRTKKGDLERAVQRVCLWPLSEGEDYYSVKYISQKVYENEAAALEKPPSLGAVAAVLQRWEKYGYAMLGRNPVRFVMLTLAGKENGLDWCRANYKAKGK